MSDEPFEPQFLSGPYIKLKDPLATFPTGFQTNVAGEPMVCGMPFRRDLTRLHIVHNRRIIGSRKWIGGRQFCWTKPGGEEQKFDFKQFSMVVGKVVYSAICVFGEPAMLVRHGELASDGATLDVPAPWTKFCIYGQDLPPDPPEGWS